MGTPITSLRMHCPDDFHRIPLIVCLKCFLTHKLCLYSFFSQQENNVFFKRSQVGKMETDF